MAEKDGEGVRVNDTGDRQWQKDYTALDVEAVFRRATPSRWGDVVKWLEQNGDPSNELTPGESVAMKEDFQKLEKSGHQFTDNPDHALKLAHQNRQGQLPERFPGLTSERIPFWAWPRARVLACPPSPARGGRWKTRCSLTSSHLKGSPSRPAGPASPSQEARASRGPSSGRQPCRSG